MANDDLISRYEKAYENYQNRRMSWVEKFHAVVKEIPHVKYAKNITEKSIKRLQQAVWPKISERAKKKARKEYERLYEEGVEGIYFPKPPYKPPTERDYMEIPYQDILPRTAPPVNEEPDDDGYKEPVDSRAEIEAWITRYIDPIDLDLIGTNLVEKDGVRDTIERLILEAADAYGDYDAYYSYLEEKAGVIVDLATKALMAYIGYKGWTYDSFPEAMPELATVLNLGRPLTKEQSERLQDEGWVSYDFND